MAAATVDPGEKRYALDRAVSVNPDSTGVASRKRMLDVTPVMPNELTEQRDVRGFMLKNLLPLGLLALVTYLSLFFAPDQAGARVGFAVTSILTASVLLESVTGPLDVGYTVAIAGVFFVYVARSAALGVIYIAVEHLYKERRYTAVHSSHPAGYHGSGGVPRQMSGHDRVLCRTLRHIARAFPGNELLYLTRVGWRT